MARQRLLATLLPTNASGLPDRASTETLDPVAVLQAIASRPDARTAGPRTIAVDVGEGRNLRIVVSPREVRFYGTLWSTRQRDEEHGGWTEERAINEALFEMVDAIVRPLITMTRWSLEPADAEAFEVVPESKCLTCGAFGFDDEVRCVKCNGVLATLDGDPLVEQPSSSDRVERHATRLVDLLLERGHLELASPRTKEPVIRRVVFGLEAEASAAELIDILVETDGVAEIYCDDTVLATLIDETAQ